MTIQVLFPVQQFSNKELNMTIISTPKNKYRIVVAIYKNGKQL